MQLFADCSTWEATLSGNVQNQANVLFLGISRQDTVVDLDALPGRPASATSPSPQAVSILRGMQHSPRLRNLQPTHPFPAAPLPFGDLKV